MAEFLVILGGIAIFGDGVRAWAKSCWLMRNGKSTLGIVIEWERSRGRGTRYYPVVAFQPRKGKLVEFKYPFSAVRGEVDRWSQGLAVVVGCARRLLSGCETHWEK